jgi:hypothetical protein
MLEGKWPVDSCLYCKDIEESGGSSDRILHLSIPELVPNELAHNPTATSVSPKLLEVYLDNTCNLSCVYCLPELSSKINQENRKHGDFNSNGVVLGTSQRIANYDKLLDKFWQWMQTNSTNLEQLNVLGGEPFYQPQFDKCLEYLEQTAHPNLNLTVVSNLKLSAERLEQYIGRIKKLAATRKIKSFTMTCSLDCWGPEQEYVRYGLDLVEWETNFKRLLQEKWIAININHTISVLTLKTLPALQQKINSWKQEHKIGQYFSVVSPQPTYMVPDIFGDLFAKDFEEILTLMPETTDIERAAKSYMHGLYNQTLNSCVNANEVLKLQTYLNEIDRRRNLNWKQLFPWLEQEIKNVLQ